MNEKLAKFAGKPVTEPRRSFGGRSSDELVLVSKSDENKGRHIVRVSLHKRAINQLGWQKKDLVYLHITDEGDLLLFRDNDRGRSLCKATGSVGRQYVRYSVTPEFFDALPCGAGRQVEIANGCIAFCMEE